MLQAGTVAPSFELKDHLGRTVKLSDYKGKKVVTAEFRKKGVPTLGISLDTVAENKAFADKFKLEYPLLCDVDHTVALAYKTIDNLKDKYARRYTYVIGSDGEIEQAIDTKDPGAQAAELLKAI